MAFFDFLKKKELEEIKHLKVQLEKFKPINNVDIEVSTRKKQLDEYVFTQEKQLHERLTEAEKNVDLRIEKKTSEINDLEKCFSDLEKNYQQALETYTRLRKEVGVFESKLDLIEHGIYEPVYDFEKSDDYRREQDRIREEQKDLIALDQAALCDTVWTVGNSEAKGKAVVNRYKKLMLRAYNGECDVLVAKVKWNNISQMKERMQKLFDTINKLGEGFNVYLNKKYLALKVKELVLEYEYQAKRQKEKEELRAVQEELREEEKARREFDQAQKEAEKEETSYQKALEKAQKEIGTAKGEKYDKLLSQIEELQRELAEAKEKKERALSMAQQTKRGHVYIISNIGSFGEHVYKIGMTRRLEPLDRIKELGDASVPFYFDIHAMIYSDEAPTLENELHKAFAHKKVNMLNYKKEFFRVTLDEIEQKVVEIGLATEFTRLPEAMEYRETIAILEKMNTSVEVKTVEEQVGEEFSASLLVG